MSRPILAAVAAFVAGWLCLLPAVAGRGPASHQGPSALRALRPNTGIETLPPEPSRRWWPFWLGLGVAGSAAVAVVCRLLLGRARQKPDVPPATWALRELDGLEKLELPTTGQVERYHTLLSDIIRRYLELRFRLRAPRQTTAEFLQGMGQSPHLNAGQQQVLRDFLERCDLAKFARADFSVAECKVVARMARDFVAQTAPERRG